MRAAVWAALSVALLAGGYADLALGGTALASVLLVAGYCAAVPLAIAAWPARADGARNGAAGAARPSYGAAGLVALAVLIVYLATLAPSTALWDTSEYIAATRVLGLPHPPGNPLFMLVGHAFGLIPLPISYAARINALVALSSALSAGLWFLVAERALERLLPARWQRIAAAAAAALAGALAFTVWNQSVVAEKVYALSLLDIAIVSWLMVQWCSRPDGRRAPHLLVLSAYLMGLGYAIHPAGFLPLPAIIVAIVVLRPATLLRWRTLLAGALMLAVGLTVFAYEPVRAAYFPPMNEGEPTGCATHIAWSCTFSQETVARLRDNINRTQYGKPSVLDRQAPYVAQVGTWWLYFRWQWLRDAYGRHPVAQGLLASLFFVLAAAGGWTHWQRHRESFWYFGTLVVTLTFALIFYLNFKYGYSQSPSLGSSVPREVRDRDYFYLWSFSALGVWIGLGLAWLWEAAAAALPGARRRLLAAPVLALALIPLATNAGTASRAGQYIARDWAVDLLQSVEPYAILITNGDNDTFPLWYAQYVEGVRPDVIVAVTTYLGIDWFGRQIIRRPVVRYDAAAGPALYRGGTWPVPAGPPLHLTFAQADSIPSYVELRDPQEFRKGAIVAHIQPGLFTRDENVTLRLIRDAWPERPIYFATSATGYAESLGLGPYLLTQGMAMKLMPGPVTASPDTIASPYGFLDLRTSAVLWDSVYRGPAEIIRENQWIDRASLSVPVNYAITGALLAGALEMRGDSAAARRVGATVRGITRAARLDLFGRSAPAGGAPAPGDTEP